MDDPDVIILGAGLVGLTLACALDAHGLRSVLIDPAEPAAALAPGFDGRATAVASASWRMLNAIGVGAQLEGRGCPIARIEVMDGPKPGGLSFDPGRPGDPLGVMFENRDLRAALRARAETGGNIAFRQPARAATVERGAHGVRVALADGGGAELRAPLLVAAEGRNSPTREVAGLRVARWRYDHRAIVTAIGHERPHENVAYEIFYPAGPFALLPMLDGTDGRPRSAVVWSVAAKDGPALAGLPDRAFAAELEKRMGGLLGRVGPIAARSTYPLGFHHAAKITAERLALVGDAAHGIHPIAGQGLNLGFRDVAALAEVLVDGARSGLDLGDPILLDRYQRWRGLDVLSVAAATDGLTRLFGVGGRAASAVRRAGMAAIDRVPAAKGWLMAEARGESGELPTLLRGALV